MRNLCCLCLVINFCCCIYVGDIFIYSFMGSGKGKYLMNFLDSNIIDSKDWERPWDCLFFPLHVSHSVWRHVQTVKDG